MTKVNQIYKCNVCGNTVEVIFSGVGKLVCCGQPMELMKIKTKNEGKEKHVPIVKKTENGIKIKVGSINHPMEDNHYIIWIQVVADGIIYRKLLKPGDEPVAEFNLNTDQISVKIYCNLHGLWSNQ